MDKLSPGGIIHPLLPPPGKPTVASSFYLFYYLFGSE